MKVFAPRLSRAVLANVVLAYAFASTASFASTALATPVWPQDYQQDYRRDEPARQPAQPRASRTSDDRVAPPAKTRSNFAKSAKKPSIGTNEFYDDLAKKKLDYEDGAEVLPHHSLEVGRDGEELVICEAGCSNEAEQVVFSAPRLRLQTYVTEFDPTSGVVYDDAPSETPGPLNPRASMPCVAGCTP